MLLQLAAVRHECRLHTLLLLLVVPHELLGLIQVTLLPLNVVLTRRLSIRAPFLLQLELLKVNERLTIRHLRLLVLALLLLSAVELLVEILPEAVDLRKSNAACLVDLQHVHLLLQLVVFFVQEVDLALQLLDRPATLLIDMLHVELLEVLRWHVHVVQAQNLFVADANLLDKGLAVRLLLLEALLQNSEHLTHLVQALISLAHLTGPLRALIQTILLVGHVVHRCEAVVRLLQQIAVDVDGLLLALQHVLACLAVELTEALDDLVLAGQVDALEGALQLGLELDQLAVKLLDLDVL